MDYMTQRTRVVLFGVLAASILLSVSLTTVYADGVLPVDPEPTPAVVEERDLIGEIVGNQHIQLALFIVVIGVALRTWSGLIGKRAKELNANHVAFSFIIAMLTSFHLVLITLQEIPDTAVAETWASAIGLGILSVYGMDVAAKKSIKHMQGRLNGTEGSGTVIATATTPVVTTSSAPSPNTVTVDVETPNVYEEDDEEDDPPYMDELPPDPVPDDDDEDDEGKGGVGTA